MLALFSGKKTYLIAAAYFAYAMAEAWQTGHLDANKVFEAAVAATLRAGIGKR